MGRGRIEIKRIENKTTRQVTFAKRRVGLLKKTHELSVLCDAQISLIIFSSNNKLFEYSSETSSMQEIIRRYQIATGMQLPKNNISADVEQMHFELMKMKNETTNLELSLQRYTGNDLHSVGYEELMQLEQQLECSLYKVRARKFELLQQQVQNLRMKEKVLKDEHEHICNMQSAMEHNQVVATMKGEQQQHRHHHHGHMMMNLQQFPFFGEEEPSSVLQLATTHFQPYRLQPTQPNLQDFSLHPSN